MVEGDTCCLAWKCLEKTYGVRGTWGSWLHLLSQDKKKECSRAVVAAVADDEHQGGVFADLTEGLLPQHLA